MKPKFRTALLALPVAVALVLVMTSWSSTMSQGAGKVSTRDFPFVLITAADVRNLPSGDSRIDQKEGDSSPRQGTTYVTPGTVRTASTKSGTIFTITFGGNQNTSVPLTKTGTGQLIFPSAAHGIDLTKVGQGTPQHSSSTAHNRTKELTGTLILATDSDVVYEFRNLAAPDFGRVFAPGSDNSNIEIEKTVRRQRPESAMQGWPFKRLLLGPAGGIATVEGWQANSGKGLKPGAAHTCQAGKFCQCSGTAACLSLANSASCSSAMNCDGSGNSVKCYCSAR